MRSGSHLEVKPQKEVRPQKFALPKNPLMRANQRSEKHFDAGRTEPTQRLSRVEKQIFHEVRVQQAPYLPVPTKELIYGNRPRPDTLPAFSHLTMSQENKLTDLQSIRNGYSLASEAREKRLANRLYRALIAVAPFFISHATIKELAEMLPKSKTEDASGKLTKSVIQRFFGRSA